MNDTSPVAAKFLVEGLRLAYEPPLPCRRPDDEERLAELLRSLRRKLQAERSH